VLDETGVKTEHSGIHPQWGSHEVNRREMKRSQATITEMKNVDEAGYLGRKGLGVLSLSKWCIVRDPVPDDHILKQYSCVADLMS
jgi:hypothetical protein